MLQECRCCKQMHHTHDLDLAECMSCWMPPHVRAAVWGGGAVFAYGTPLALHNCSFTGNQVRFVHCCHQMQQLLVMHVSSANNRSSTYAAFAHSF
jgi:hypothetical protein